MKATSLFQLYRASGFAAPSQRRKAAEHTEKFKQMFDERHPLLGEFQGSSRLRSRKNFLKTVQEDPPLDYPLREEDSAGQHLDWVTWKSLNRIRTGVAPVKTNKAKWGLITDEDTKCECGEIQNMEHLLSCIRCPHTCTLENLWNADENALDVARYWAKEF